MQYNTLLPVQLFNYIPGLESCTQNSILSSFLPSIFQNYFTLLALYIDMKPDTANFITGSKCLSWKYSMGQNCKRTACTRSAETPPKVNRFEINLEQCEPATVSILFFGPVNNARFRRFFVGKTLRHFNTTTSIGVLFTITCVQYVCKKSVVRNFCDFSYMLFTIRSLRLSYVRAAHDDRILFIEHLLQ